MGAAPGDLYITTKVEPHPFFRREGDNIEITVPIAVAANTANPTTNETYTLTAYGPGGQNVSVSISVFVR